MAVSTRRPAASIFVCTACAAESPKWAGRCSTCGSWNCLVEGVAPTTRGRTIGSAVPQALADVISGVASHRPTGIGELDRVLGGGIVDGALVLLSGDPGIGKSTLALQMAGAFGTVDRPALYCAGEESPAQLAMRARRLECAGRHVLVVGETDLDRCIAAVESTRPSVAIIDSVQTIDAAGAGGHPGSPGQVREAVARLMGCAKSTGVPIVLIGHVTKDGAIAGPRTLEHMVDVVLFLEGERHGEHRVLRGFKNRFGATGELGLFAMCETGMQPVDTPGRAFLDETSLEAPGNVLTVTCEGSRALVVEVQSLTAGTPYPQPRRTANGFEMSRLHLILAVLDQRGAVKLDKDDVYLNCVGGVRLVETAVDLAALLAIAGAKLKLRLPADCVVIGEVGLGGELRRVRRLDARLGEATQLGITTAIVPAGHGGDVPSGIRCIRVSTVLQALALLR